MPKYKNIKGKEINVHCKPVKKDEVFEAKEDMEMEVLIREGFVKKVGGTNDGG